MATLKKRASNKVAAPPPEKERRKRRTMSQNDMLTHWTESRVLIPQRVIYLGSVTTDVEGNESGVDAAMAQKFETALRILEYFDKTAPITVILTSFGGAYEYAMSIYDRIKRSTCPITIEATGPVMSSGIILMQAAHTRILARHSRVMVHYPHHTIEGRHIEELVKQIQNAKDYNEEMERIFLARMQVKRKDLTIEQLRELLRFEEWSLSASEAVSWGLADFVARPSAAQLPVPSTQKKAAPPVSDTSPE